MWICMWQIKKNVLDSIQLASRNIYPNEFISLLSGSKEKELIDSLIILPSTFGKNFSTIRLDLLPFDESFIGSVHSHPSRNNSPSDADLEMFHKTGLVHIIVGYPYEYSSFKLYKFDGKQLRYEII